MKAKTGLASLALAAFLGLALAGALWGAWRAAQHLRMDLGLHGWIALIGGTLVTLALAGALMSLVFFSARRGFDEAHPPDPES